VDPDGVRSPHQRAKRAEWARKAHMQRLALKLAAARQRRKLICQRCSAASRKMPMRFCSGALAADGLGRSQRIPRSKP
jgi:hypothetical protein